MSDAVLMTIVIVAGIVTVVALVVVLGIFGGDD